MSQEILLDRRSWRAIQPKGTRLLLIILVLITASCSSDDADPGDERLRTLLDDPVLAVEPSGAQIVKTDERTGFDPGAFNFPPEGPSVGQTYRVTGDVRAVRSSFRSQIEDAGWQLYRTFKPQGALYPYLSFEKDMGGWTARLSVSQSSDDELVLILSAPPVNPAG